LTSLATLSVGAQGFENACWPFFRSRCLLSLVAVLRVKSATVTVVLASTASIPEVAVTLVVSTTTVSTLTNSALSITKAQKKKGRGGAESKKDGQRVVVKWPPACGRGVQPGI
jgi:hypothetical protein